MFEKILNIRLSEADKAIDKMPDMAFETIVRSDLGEFIKCFLVNTKKDYFDKKTLTADIDKAIKLLLNYTLRPKWTLLNFIFGSSDSKQSKEIMNKLECFIFYSFYVETIKSYITESDEIAIKKVLIESLIDRINLEISEKLNENLSALKIKNFFQQVFRLKYGDNAEISLDMSVPYSYIKLFLEDKSFNSLVKMFKDTGAFNDDTEVELKTIIKVMTGQFTSSIDSVFEEVKPRIAEPEIIENKTDDVIIEEKKKPVPEIHVPKDTVIYESTFEEQQEKVVIPTEQIDDSTTGTSDNLRYLFKEDEIKIISKKIFDNDRYAMFDFLNQMQDTRNWREATEKLKTLFLNNKVNHYDKNVILFVDILSDYFDKRDK